MMQVLRMDQDLGNDTCHVSRVTCDIVRCLSFVAAPSPVVSLLTSPICSLVVLSSLLSQLCTCGRNASIDQDQDTGGDSSDDVKIHNLPRRYLLLVISALEIFNLKTLW